MELLRFFRVDLVITVLAVVAAFVYDPTAGTVAIVLLLIVLEISISFDNAIVNATVVRNLSEFWQKLFLTVGVLIAVFGMRLVFPIAIVAITAGLGAGEVIDLAFNDPDEYGEKLEDASLSIEAFGGAFLLMVFLSYFMDDEKEIHWFGPVERGLARLGGVNGLAIGIGLVLLLLTQAFVDESQDKLDILLAGAIGLATYVVISGIADLLEASTQGATEEGSSGVGGAVVGLTGKAAFASFMYLEVLDASFSFDGVIGAFAITKEVVLIAIGLGVGALYVRSLTVYLVRKGTLSDYRFLEHGAHYAIGALAAILLMSAHFHIPEVITGLLGVAFIGAGLLSSIKWNKEHGGAEEVTA
ncbi:membrane protein [Paraconexibacter sp. AEG42_29]|uniref:Membrane protein n=1 Tax=Paraconexibacter sp. AEG42_29 TaxID=2997339 RepID=A0AAU7AZW5_9ACTN